MVKIPLRLYLKTLELTYYSIAVEKSMVAQ